MRFRNSFVGSFVFLLAGATASAAPILRLSGTDLCAQRVAGITQCPAWIQQGTNGPANILFEAYNIGDGALNPQARGSHAWLNPIVDPARPCSFEPGRSCRPVRVLFNSASLAVGPYDGVVIISDSGAFDAPQTVAVRIYVAGNVPARLDFYLPPTPGAADSVTFQTPSGPAPGLRPTTQSGGNWLAVSSSGMGSFQFLYTHTISAIVQGGQGAGDYNGAVAVTNSSFAADNRSVPVALHVTTQPIARPAPPLARLRGVTGGAAVELNVAVANRGGGTLTVAGATAAGEAWLTASMQPDNVVQVRAEPGSLAAGYYNGTVTINSNAANAAVTLPVEFELQAAGGPLADFGGVVDAASFTRPVAGGALASLFGSQLAPSVAQAAAIPLPTTLAETQVFVNDSPAPLIFVSPAQINFQLPWSAAGTALVRVDRAGQRGNTVTVQAARRAAGLYTLRGPTYAVAVNFSRGSGGFALPDIPLFADIPKAPARPGDVLVLYGSGFGPVNPAVNTGAAAGADPATRGELSSVTEMPRVNFSRTPFGPFADPQFVGLTPGFVGLFQVNVEVPAGVPPNPRTALRLEWPDGSLSNTVEIAVAAP